MQIHHSLSLYLKKKKIIKKLKKKKNQTALVGCIGTASFLNYSPFMGCKNLSQKIAFN